jgi:hypothetical protein
MRCVFALMLVFGCGGAPAPAPPTPAPSPSPYQPPASQPAPVDPHTIPIRTSDGPASEPVTPTADAWGASITGIVTDAKAGEPLPAVTVVVMSLPQRVHDRGITATAITDEHGRYTIGNLEPATYKVTFYYTDITLETSAIVVTKDSRMTVNQEIDQSKAGTGNIIHVHGSKTTIVPLSTKP